MNAILATIFLELSNVELLQHVITTVVPVFYEILKNTFWFSKFLFCNDIDANVSFQKV